MFVAYVLHRVQGLYLLHHSASSEAIEAKFLLRVSITLEELGTAAHRVLTCGLLVLCLLGRSKFITLATPMGAVAPTLPTILAEEASLAVIVIPVCIGATTACRFEKLLDAMVIGMLCWLSF